MGSLGTEAKLPWSETPCVFSPQMSRVAGCNIYLKLDNLQPSGSFKSRGIGNLMTRAVAAAPGDVHFYCVSGGNAGLACATSAVALRRPATIVIPMTTSNLMKNKLLDLGVEVHQTGKNLAAADEYLRTELLPKDPTAVYVPPFDHPHVWDGASTIVPELRSQMDVPMDAIVCSVGGGGLFNGLMQGIESYPWSGNKPDVVCVETAGADSLNASLRANAHVTLPEITSIATSLGCSRVSAESWKWIQYPNTHSLVVSDADAAISCVRFADDARHLVEISCGAALATVYRGDLRERLGRGLTDGEWADKNIVLIVCGGSGVTLGILDQYRAEYGSQTSIKA
ncbi:pyridoxal-phosphate dependent enzyme [Hirsutella rhossiliensis]|uniref:L-serine ammonia-lyase n=1 Tax=Hirsutella rhossiliensis TaxID=111463 RepID=A0A9P8MZQ7_9HYPO|nr:pyridoxal-phosphate dependent enzyme domain-containing protein [Hirsutella rhossiliensis]KAH0965023.1 pyridoxal-phosphate dependent enzyme domain-containing protein [Hirsutella rhossiliensis]